MAGLSFRFNLKASSPVLPAHAGRSTAAGTFSYNDMETFCSLSSSSDRIVFVGDSPVRKTVMGY